MNPAGAGKPDAGTALGLAMIARERRERELDRAIDDLDLEDTLARMLNADSAEYFPPLAVAILTDRLTRPQRARLAVLAPKFRPASMEYDALQAHFEALGKAARL